MHLLLKTNKSVLLKTSVIGALLCLQQKGLGDGALLVCVKTILPNKIAN